MPAFAVTDLAKRYGEVEVLRGVDMESAKARAATGYLAELYRFPGWLVRPR